MEYRIEFDEKRGIVVLRFLQDVTEDLLLSTAVIMRDLIRDKEPVGRITDYTDARKILVSSEFVRKFAISDVYELTRPDLKRIIVAPQPVVFGLARMFQANRDSVGQAPVVVRTMDEALEVLGVESLDLRPVR
jgi:hypothetical protein